MARVSLILPLAPGSSLSEDAVDRVRLALERRGHTVEVVAVADPRMLRTRALTGSAATLVMAPKNGLASSAIEGLCVARGDIMVVLDFTRGYAPEDVARTVDALSRDEAALVVAQRRASGLLGGRLQIGLGALARPILGSVDPLSGLVALTRREAQSIAAECVPSGSLFALELLVRSRTRCVDVAVGPETRVTGVRYSIDDLRLVKRLADDRLGNFSRLIQFCAVGASGMVVDLSFYALFQLAFAHSGLSHLKAPLIGGALDLAVSGALAILVALTWNFTLNRRLTFSYARKGSLVRQYLTYALSNALGIALSFSLRLVLPTRLAFFARHKLAAAVVGIVAATGISFSMSRWLVFRRRPASPGVGGTVHRASSAHLHDRPSAVYESSLGERNSGCGPVASSL